MPGRFLYFSEVLLRLMPEHDYAVRLEALAEALPLEVAATDVEGRVVVWNAALAAAAGPRAEALGRPLLDAVPWLREDPNVDWAVVLHDVLRGGPGRTYPRHPLGQRVVRATVGPMIGDRGSVLGAVLSIEDITRGTREEERRRLDARSQAVTALGAGMAHEIRNPLNALSLNLQLLRERLADPAATRDEYVQKADAMIAEVARMETLVQNLLEVSRGGAPVCEDERIDDLVADVLRRMEAAAAELGVRVNVKSGSHRAVPLERMRIERAVQNLVENAIDAAGENGNVWISTRDDPHSTVLVVEDDGPGIKPEERARVFELFWTNKRGGTGLGLPLARRAVESHGGEVEILDRPGGGTRVIVHLPVREGQDVREIPGGEPWPAS